METSPTRLHGHVLAALGAAGLGGSLWAPWYTFQFPQSLIDQTAGVANQMGAFGQFLTRGAELLRALGPYHVTAWQLFTTGPALILVLSVVAGGLALLALTGRAAYVGQVIAGAGAAGFVLAFYRVLVRPGPSGLLHMSWGLYLALGAALLVVAGGLLSARAEREVDHEPIAADPFVLAGPLPAPAPADSVAPPGF
jgi:hypothetical protein